MAHRRGIVFMLFLMLNAIFLSALFHAIFPLYIRASIWFIIFGQIMIFLVPSAVWLAFFREKINQHLPHMRLGKTNIILITALSLTLQPVMMTVSGLTTFFFPNETGELLLGFTEEYSYWLMIIAVAVTPAICEEVVFRGYIQSTYKDKAFWTMALINGLFFAIIHFNLQQFPYAFIMGIIFAYMVYATRSIRAGVISHFIMNASQITLLWGLSWLLERVEYMAEEMGYDFPGMAQTAEDIDFTSPEMIAGFAMIGVVVIGAAVGSAFLFREFHNHNKKRAAEYDAKQAELSVVAADAGEEIFSELSEEVTGISQIPEIELISPAPPIPLTLGEKRKNFVIDTLLVLVIVALYAFLMIPAALAGG